MMHLRLEARPQASSLMIWLAPVIAVVATLGAGALLFALLGYPPLVALRVYFVDPIQDLNGLAELAVKATPLALCAIGLAIGFRGNVWNIGADGQLTIGAIAGGGLALLIDHGSSWWVLPAIALAGVAGGAAWAAIPAYLRLRFNANEILVSLMLTYVAWLLLSYLVHGPWRDPMGFNFPQSRSFERPALLPNLIEGTRLHLGALAALLAVIVAALVMSRGLFGFQIRVLGAAPAAAAYAGFDRRRLTWASLLIGGGLAGLAGLIEVAGPIRQLLPSVSPGYGFTAIIVAFLGRLHPVGILFAALLVALTYIGGELAQILLRLPVAVTGVFQGMLLFFLLAADVLVRYRPRLIR
jgi:simple sugar transport system permease protein